MRGAVGFAALWEAINFALALSVTTVLFGLIFKLVPDAKIAWRDVWLAGFITSIAFSVGRTLLSWYIARSATVSPFGAAGSLVALIIWVYYSAQILFFAAELARAYATRNERPIVPKSHAFVAEPDECDRA